ncbi:MAG: hypothetical protein JXA54_07505 [Candidatus Heimdallarchaeota archaeon]|nr:hypothetical protein [Candidatus Heimdallarchaeota archaeon]
MYIFLGQCFSGAFIPYLNNSQNRAIYTSCNSTQGAVSYDNSPTDTHSYWPWLTYRSLHPGTGKNQNAEEADTNSDNRVSLYEMFTWCNYTLCITLVFRDVHPQRWVGSIIGSDTNDFIGSETYL